jgi:hypothetical protein
MARRKRAGAKPKRNPRELPPYRATKEELAGIDRGLREANKGKFASDAEVEAVFAKSRGK